MHQIEPFSNWHLYYQSNEDPKSVFYNTTYNQLEYTNTIYNFYIGSQWDNFGSSTLYLKILFADYKKHFVIIELIGEWNDLIENDIMFLKRNIIDELRHHKINKFILITENVLNFFRGDDDYYLEWVEEVTDKKGWIAIVNMPIQSKYEFNTLQENMNLHYIEINNWRTFVPQHFYEKINQEIKILLN